MEPRIQYAKTTDGVSIAYWSIGSGPPIVWMPTIPTTHVEREWDLSPIREAFETVARTNTLVRYDARGFGLSDPDVTDFSVDAMLRDLEAVTDRLQLDLFQIVAFGYAGPAGIAYTARHPERVSHLVLWHVPAVGSDVGEQYFDMAPLAMKDWELFTESWIRATLAWTEGALPRAGVELMRASADPARLQAWVEQLRDLDVRDLLPGVTVPTLVMHRRDNRLAPLDASRRIAAAIPDAQLQLLEGSSYYFDTDGLDASLAFLHGSDRPRSDRATSDVAVILFTDLVGHTGMMSRLGDERGRAVLREHERITRGVLAAHRGTEVKTMGDGFMASFGSVMKAVECAVALQKAFAEHEGEALSVRVGLNAGEPIEDDGDLFGATVILASRIAAKAEGGEILVSDNVRSLSAGKGFLFADRGEFVAKGIEEPVRVYEVKWGE